MNLFHFLIFFFRFYLLLYLYPLLCPVFCRHGIKRRLRHVAGETRCRLCSSSDLPLPPLLLYPRAHHLPPLSGTATSPSSTLFNPGSTTAATSDAKRRPFAPPPPPPPPSPSSLGTRSSSTTRSGTLPSTRPSSPVASRSSPSSKR